MLLLLVVRLGFGGLKGTVKFAQSLGNLYVGGATKAIGLGLGAAKLGLGVASNLLGSGKKKIADLYVRGEKEPRLLAWKLKAGKYRDQATGKVIKTLKDVKGTVLDENGEIVLNASEIKNTLVNKGRGVLGTLQEVVGSTVDKVQSLVGGTMGLGFNLAFGGMKMGLKGLSFMNRKMKDNQDIYVAGEKEPRLLGVVFPSGFYISAASNKPILRSRDVEDPS